jgi:hypothetical protein
VLRLSPRDAASGNLSFPHVADIRLPNRYQATRNGGHFQSIFLDISPFKTADYGIRC